MGTGAALPREILMCDPPTLLGITLEQEERPFLLPQPLVLLVLQGHHTPNSRKMELAGPSSRADFRILLVTRAQGLSPQPSSPSSTLPALDSPSSSSPHAAAQLGPGSPSLCQSQHGHSPVVTAPSSPWTGRK